jgi:hypothetical protein
MYKEVVPHISLFTLTFLNFPPFVPDPNVFGLQNPDLSINNINKQIIKKNLDFKKFVDF